MIERIIRASVAARGLVVAAALILTLIGIAAVRTTPLREVPGILGRPVPASRRMVLSTRPKR